MIPKQIIACIIRACKDPGAVDPRNLCNGSGLRQRNAHLCFNTCINQRSEAAKQFENPKQKELFVYFSGPLQAFFCRDCSPVAALLSKC
jgi:hypothetical protein